jgi:Meckel syndrome type 1 protein
VCGVLHLPLHEDAASMSPYAHGLSLALSTLCLLLGAALAVRSRAVPVLAAGVLLPGVLAVAHLTAGRLASPLLADVLAAGGSGATLSALLAAVLALVALLGASAGRGSGDARRHRGPATSALPGAPGAPEASSSPPVHVRAADS